MIAANANMKSRMEPKAGPGGRALLAGLLRCRRCGRMLHVAYVQRRLDISGWSAAGRCLAYGADGDFDQ
jgi:hypothetical protein